MNLKLDWSWPAVVVFVTVFGAVSVLVFFGKVPAAALGALLTWLIPSPIQAKGLPGPTQDPGVH